jgi:hypothetical protein
VLITHLHAPMCVALFIQHIALRCDMVVHVLDSSLTGVSTARIVRLPFFHLSVLIKTHQSSAHTCLVFRHFACTATRAAPKKPSAAVPPASSSVTPRTLGYAFSPCNKLVQVFAQLQFAPSECPTQPPFSFQLVTKSRESFKYSSTGLVKTLYDW